MDTFMRSLDPLLPRFQFIPGVAQTAFFLIEVKLLYNIIQVTGVQCSNSQFLKVIIHLYLL